MSLPKHLKCEKNLIPEMQVVDLYRVFLPMVIAEGINWNDSLTCPCLIRPMLSRFTPSWLRVVFWSRGDCPPANFLRSVTSSRICRDMPGKGTETKGLFSLAAHTPPCFPKIYDSGQLPFETSNPPSLASPSSPW